MLCSIEKSPIGLTAYHAFSLIVKVPTTASQPQSSAEQSDMHRGASGARALLDASSTPDIRGIDELIVIEVAAKWNIVAIRLGLEDCVIKVVSMNHPNDCEGACRDMLDRWLRGERHTGEEERTWSTLLTALGGAGFVELERRLRRKHFY